MAAADPGSAAAGGARPVRIVTIGDALIDVVAVPDRIPVIDGDVPARVELGCGGQAANVAAWCTWLGAAAAVIATTGDDAAAGLVRGLLAAHGVRLVGPVVAGRTGAIVSLVDVAGSRTMLSDRAASARLSAQDLRADWFEGVSWLYVSGYCLFGHDGGQAAITAAEMASTAGARIGVDLSAATLVADLGPREVRRRIGLLGAELVLANDAEADAVGETGAATVVVKQGAAGHRVVVGGRSVQGSRPSPITAVDTTGAGDAFAAGWMMGGAATAERAAAACISRLGAMPPPP